MGMDAYHLNFFGYFIDINDLEAEADEQEDVDKVQDLMDTLDDLACGETYSLEGTDPLVVVSASDINDLFAIMFRKYSYTAGFGPDIREDYKGVPTDAEKAEFIATCKKLGLPTPDSLDREETDWFC